jgi:oligopeptide transport system permease protein
MTASPVPPTIAVPQRRAFPFRGALRNPRIVLGGGVLIVIVALCLATMFWTLNPASTFYYKGGSSGLPVRSPPSFDQVALWFGTDKFGRSILARCLLGGVVSMSVGVAAAAISVALGVTVGLIAGYRGGWIDSALMRTVDVLYGLPYILLIILFKIAFEEPLAGVSWIGPQAANLLVLFAAIGLVSWLTMARVVRGQVLSLRGQPFVEACYALGLPERRIFIRHLLPNLVGPITVYATLTIPQAILQESFLSFLGVGISPPLPTWGALASENQAEALSLFAPRWWLLLFPCILLALTLLSLNFVGDGLRDRVDPRREAAKL